MKKLTLSALVTLLLVGLIVLVFTVVPRAAIVGVITSPVVTVEEPVYAAEVGHVIEFVEV